MLEWGLIYCGVVFDGFLQRKQAKVTQRVETAIRAESTATWNEVKVGVESCVRCQKITQKNLILFIQGKSAKKREHVIARHCPSKISSTSSTTSIFSSCSVARRRGPIEIKWLKKIELD